jgi:hypothetical protein
MKKHTTLIALALIFGVATMSCKKNDKNVPVTDVTLNVTAKTMDIGDTLVLTATVAPSKATNKRVTWMSTTPAVASVENGRVIALAEGTTTIVATTVDGGRTAMCNVTVGTTSTTVPVTSITFTQKFDNMNASEERDFIVEFTPTDATDKRVKWTTSHPDIIAFEEGEDGDVIDGKNRNNVMVHHYVPTEDVTVTVTSVSNPDVKVTHTIHVNGKTVTIVGNQTNTLTQGTAGVIGYEITTSGITGDMDGSIQWYPNSYGTGTPISAPTGVSLATGILLGQALLFGSTTAATPAGTYYFRATIDGTESNVGTLVIGAAPAKTVTVGTQNNTLTAGASTAVTFPVTTTGIAAGTYGATVSNMPTGMTHALYTVTPPTVRVDIDAEGKGSLLLRGSATTVAGTYNNLTLTIDGTTSPAFTLTIAAP